MRSSIKPFGFALTDPYRWLSRIRLFAKVNLTPARTSRREVRPPSDYRGRCIGRTHQRSEKLLPPAEAGPTYPSPTPNCLVEGRDLKAFIFELYRWQTHGFHQVPPGTMLIAFRPSAHLCLDLHAMDPARGCHRRRCARLDLRPSWSQWPG